MFRVFLKSFPRRLPSLGPTVLQNPTFRFHRPLAALVYTKTTDAEIRAQPEKFVIRDLEEYHTSKDPGDVFGTYAGSDVADEPNYDEDLQDEEDQAFTPKGRKMPLYGYARLIKNHMNNKEIKEAIDVLEVRMKEDKVKPTAYIYNLLISGCGSTGYSKKAFLLYNKMKQRALPVRGGTYTSLFNACANSPWKEDGLSKANRLREIMAEKGYEPNSSNYNAMIKAYGRCGDTKTAFLLADELLDKRIPIRTDTFNFLLQACASDVEYGFRHALLVWHKMRKTKSIPDIYSFRLMLRCVRDCGLGDVESLKEVIEEIVSYKGDLQLLSGEKQLQIAGATEGSVQISEPPTVLMNAAPNLLQVQPHLGSLVEINEVNQAQDRLLLIGGFSGFLEEMKRVNVTPNIEAFTAMLEVIPPTIAAEKQLLNMIQKIGLKADIDFFNILMKKRAMRFDYQSSREVLDYIRLAKLQPDVVTYGVLSLSCKQQEEARELLQQMNMKGIRMNAAILGAMLRQGCAQQNFSYVYEIMQIALEEKVKPNEQFLRHLNNFCTRCAKLIEQKHPQTKKNNFKHNFNNFEKRLKTWYEEHGLENLTIEDQIKKMKGKPFDQYKTPKEIGYEQIKNEHLLKKQKVMKYIKKIKLKDLGTPAADVSKPQPNQHNQIQSGRYVVK